MCTDNSDSAFTTRDLANSTFISDLVARTEMHQAARNIKTRTFVSAVYVAPFLTPELLPFVCSDRAFRH